MRSETAPASGKENASSAAPRDGFGDTESGRLGAFVDASTVATPDGISAALRAVAVADADIEGQAHDAAYTLERLVLTVADLRTGR